MQGGIYFATHFNGGIHAVRIIDQFSFIDVKCKDANRIAGNDHHLELWRNDGIYFRVVGERLASNVGIGQQDSQEEDTESVCYEFHAYKVLKKYLFCRR